jgi:anion-transporting  ArsA/GET3 family ATPase
MLGGRAIGPQVEECIANVWAVNMRPDQALEEYGTLVLRSRALYRTLFDNRYVRAFLRAVPGMQEWSMLGKAWWHTTERRPDGSFKYDVVLLDAPATGHGLEMLRVPAVILEVVPPGLLRRDAERAIGLLRDPETSAVVLVTLPEEMPTTETLELAREISQMGLPIERVVVNGVLPPLFSKQERIALENSAPFRMITRGDAAIATGRDRAIRERAQAQSLERLLRELAVPPIFLPLLMEDAANPEAIRSLARRV